MIIITTSRKNQAIKIKSIQANSLYIVNAYNKNKNEVADTQAKKPYLDIGEAVINNSQFSDYMEHHSVAVNKKGRSKDFIVMKFDYGVKNEIIANELRDYYYKTGQALHGKYMIRKEIS